MTWTIAIDPGANPGFAWGNGGTLIGCSSTLPEGWLFSARGAPIQPVVEFPTVRPGTPDANSIVRLAFTAGRIVQRIAAEGAHVRPVVEVQPVRWKGNIDKWRHHPRIVAALAPAERRAVEIAVGDLDYYLSKCRPPSPPKSNPAYDILDAVGLLLWQFERRV